MMLVAAFNEFTKEHAVFPALNQAQGHTFNSGAKPTVIGGADGRAWIRAATPGNPPTWWETTVRLLACDAVRKGDQRRQRTICEILVLVGPSAVTPFGTAA